MLTRGLNSAQNAGGHRIQVRKLFQKPYDVDVKMDFAGHGGGDKRLLSTIFGPLKGEAPEEAGASRMGATEMDGGESSAWSHWIPALMTLLMNRIAYALAIGLAANESFKSNQMIDCEEMLKL